MRHCQVNPLLKKKGIPECILFVTQRLTKYPLLIEPLIKTSKDNKIEQERFVKALAFVKVRKQHRFSSFSIHKRGRSAHWVFQHIVLSYLHLFENCKSILT
jgi:hypothetical protein